jgi:putative PIN family toxin of toxin-antitoxin system
MGRRIVIDTNVFVSALLSRQGASFRLLSLIDSGKFELCLSVPVVLEYEAVAKRQVRNTKLSASDIDAIIDYLCLVASHFKIYYLWRPILKDPNDEMVLELAVTANADVIVTYNKTDFKGSESFGIHVLTAQEFLSEIGEIR